MAQKILVIGGGQAAASFVARVRSHDNACEITLVTEEDYLPYQRPPLSKKYATGDMSRDQLLLRPTDWYETNRIRCLTSTQVDSIDTDKKTATHGDGDVINWDKLLIATGSRPRILPGSIGGDLPQVSVLRTLEDADLFASRIGKSSTALIVGGGYIGLEAAAVCASKGMSVTVVEAADRILQRVACPETSDRFREIHEKHGVRFLEGVGLSAFTEENGILTGATLTDGEEISSDFALIGIGILPNAELAESAGITVDNGIVVDPFCRTSHEDVYAAGDCAVFEYSGEATRLESVQNAIDQAECAADNVCGLDREYIPYPWFWSDQYDVKLQIAGLNRGYDEVICRPGEREGAVSHFYFDGDRFLAVDAINDPRTYMVCKKLLEAGKGISRNQAADLSLELKSLL